MERIFNKARSSKEAENWDILQQISMTPEERQRIAKELRKRFYRNKPAGLRRKKK
jgi:predicted Fe-S protein YdhL (DUF1289 family)